MTKGKRLGQKKHSSVTVSTPPTSGPTSSPTCYMENQTGSPPDGTVQAGSPAFDALMLAITTYQSTLTAKIENAQTEIALMCRDMDRFRDQVTDVERRVSGTEDVQRNHHEDLQTLKLKIKNLKARVEDAENRNRRNNLHVLGLPEGTEGSDPVALMEHLLPTLLLQATFSPHFSIERVHRMLATRGPQGWLVQLGHSDDSKL